MRSLGKERRLRRLLDPGTGRGVIVPLDHGVSVGPVRGVERVDETVASVVRGGAHSIVVHKGLVRSVHEVLGNAGLWLHVSASTSLNPDPNDKRIVCSVEEALSLGADGVSVHVNVGSPTESNQVEDLGRLATDCHRYGVPLLAMMYPRGPAIDDPHDVDHVKHVARLGAELGADVLKVPYTGDPESFRGVVNSVDVPVVISGGARMASDDEVREVVAGAVEAGGAGISIGRNVWQREDPEAMTRSLADIVLRGEAPKTARSTPTS